MFVFSPYVFNYVFQKVFTALLALQARDQGFIDLADPISKHLKSFSMLSPYKVLLLSISTRLLLVLEVLLTTR